MNARLLKFVAVFLGAALSGWAADPLIGTWKLDLSKSIFNPGPTPKSQIRVYQAVPGGGMKLTLTTIDVEGKSQSIDLPATPDGKKYPITGLGQADTVMLTPLTDRTAEAKLKYGDVVIGTARRELSPDGNTLTITYTGIDREGGQVSNIAVYAKQK
jgi:hypothetical protein